MFLPFLRKRRVSSQIEKVSVCDDFLLSPNNLRIRLREIDLEISQTTSAMIDAQRVSIISFFSTNQNFINRLQTRVYQSAASNSFTWHRNKLFQLYKDRQKFQLLLDKSTGKFWINRIRIWLIYIALFICFTVLIWIFFMGLMALIYMLPFVFVICGVFYFAKKVKSS